jgi:hypothetical protein
MPINITDTCVREVKESRNKTQNANPKDTKRPLKFKITIIFNDVHKNQILEIYTRSYMGKNVKEKKSKLVKKEKDCSREYDNDEKP